MIKTPERQQMARNAAAAIEGLTMGAPTSPLTAFKVTVTGTGAMLTRT